LTYKAAATKSFLREFKKMPTELQERVKEVIDDIITDPFKGTKLRGELEGQWRWRVGDYRIIYLIGKENQIVLLDVGPRKSVYG
jgi:mRNA interferase RelE/StbE